MTIFRYLKVIFNVNRLFQRFKFIRRKFEDINGESVVKISSFKVQTQGKDEKVAQLTPSVDTFRKLAEKGAIGLPFSDHKLRGIDHESERTKGGSIGKRKFKDFNTFIGEKANFSPSKRMKTKNCPNFTGKSDRFGNYSVKGVLENTTGDSEAKKGTKIKKRKVFLSDR